MAGQEFSQLLGALGAWIERQRDQIPAADLATATNLILSGALIGVSLADAEAPELGQLSIAETRVVERARSWALAQPESEGGRNPQDPGRRLIAMVRESTRKREVLGAGKLVSRQLEPGVKGAGKLVSRPLEPGVVDPAVSARKRVEEAKRRIAAEPAGARRAGEQASQSAGAVDPAVSARKRVEEAKRRIAAELAGAKGAGKPMSRPLEPGVKGAGKLVSRRLEAGVKGAGKLVSRPVEPVVDPAVSARKRVEEAKRRIAAEPAGARRAKVDPAVSARKRVEEAKRRIAAEPAGARRAKVDPAVSARKRVEEAKRRIVAEPAPVASAAPSPPAAPSTRAGISPEAPSPVNDDLFELDGIDSLPPVQSPPAAMPLQWAAPSSDPVRPSTSAPPPVETAPRAASTSTLVTVGAPRLGGHGQNAFTRELAGPANSSTDEDAAAPQQLSAPVRWRRFEEYFWWGLCFVAVAILAWRRLL